METIFEVKFTVTSADIDDLNHVNNVVYVKWMDEVAFKHWAFLTTDFPLPAYIAYEMLYPRHRKKYPTNYSLISHPYELPLIALLPYSNI